MFNVFNIMSKKNLKKLDAELSKVNYNELIGGLNQLSYNLAVNENPEELRVIYAITQCCLELQKIYKGDK